MDNNSPASSISREAVAFPDARATSVPPRPSAIQPFQTESARNPNPGPDGSLLISDSLDQSIQTARTAIGNEQDPRRRVQLLCQLGSQFEARFRTTNASEDLNGGIAAFEGALELIMMAHAERVPPTIQANAFCCCGALLRMRYRRTGDIADIDRSVEMHARAVDLTPESQDTLPIFLNDLANSLHSRYRRTGRIGDLERAISLHRRAATLIDSGQPGHALSLHNTGNVLLSLFRRTGDTRHLDEAISVLRRAVESVPDPDDPPTMVSMLAALGESLRSRYEHTHDLESLKQSIIALRRAVKLVPERHPMMASCLDELGVSLCVHYEHTAELDYLEQSILYHRRAVDLTPDSSPNKSWTLNNLGNALYLLSQRDPGSVGHIDQAISVQCRALELVPDKHAHFAVISNNLGRSYSARFQHTGAAEDIERAIEHYRRAIEHTRDGHPSKALRINNYGTALHMRYKRSGRLEDLEGAIQAFEYTVALTPAGHPDMPGCLANLSSSLGSQYDRTGAVESLHRAVFVVRKVVDATPDDHPMKSTLLTTLGVSLTQLGSRTESLASLDEAVSILRSAAELAPTGSYEKSKCLSTLGTSLFARFRLSEDLRDIDQTIAASCTALDLVPSDHPDKLSCLSNASNALMGRYQLTGDLADIDLAITFARRGIDMMPANQADTARWFMNLGSALLLRFQRTKEHDDIEGSISILRQAIDMTPDGNEDKAGRYVNLAIALAERFGSGHDMEDIRAAIRAQTRALSCVSDKHLITPTVLRGLGDLHRERFLSTQDINDIETAISYGQRAVAWFSDESKVPAIYYDNLGASLSLRYRHTERLEDLEAAIALSRRAIELTADGDVSLAAKLRNNGLDHQKLFERTGAQEAFGAAIRSFTQSLMQLSGDPFVRLDSAKHCIVLLALRPEAYPLDSLLNVLSRMVAILPEIAWHGYDVHRRLDESSRLGSLVTMAVFIAVANRAKLQAVEWLEAGRSLIWKQILSLRTPLGDLQRAHPDLAESLRGIQSRLSLSTHRSVFSPEVHAFGGIPGLTVNTAADSHRSLAVEYDKVLKEIRALPGFSNFLLPENIHTLLPKLHMMDGPVVFINTHPARCDAITVCPDGTVTTIPLPGLTKARVVQMQALLGTCLSEGRNSMRGFPLQDSLSGDNTVLEMLNHRDDVRASQQHGVWANRGEEDLARVLEYLWVWIVDPILQALDIKIQVHGTHLPHISWCPTGPLAQMPLHAAGVYSDPSGPRAFDYVVPSYTTSLSATLRGFQGVAEGRPAPSVLVVTQPATPGLSRLPETQAEALCIQGILEGVDIRHAEYTHDQATVQAVRDVLNQHPWVHLACHGSQNETDATQSAFALYDGPLTLSDLMGTVAQNAELAFLSACQTAVGDERVPEESAHLAAGMLAVGYKGVVATMWSIQDADAPVVVEAFYKELFAFRAAGENRVKGTGAAYALHEATKVLRETVGEQSFMRWVPFVHFGA
ncbi:unnamed protein product [Peniophora sp. CBMAI 1063]|nr:unnamed protein product [Peniophora sp. CBMAI 1063]